jgi:hypothetical protein
MHVSITSKKVACRTELNIVSDVIPAEMRYRGWQESLIHLAKRAEAEVPGKGKSQTPIPRSQGINRVRGKPKTQFPGSKRTPIASTERVTQYLDVRI